MPRLPAKSDTERISKSAYRDRADALRVALLEMQVRLRSSSLKAVVLVCGVDGAGKGDVVNVLNHWLDPRWIRSRAFDAPSDEESERPPFWRYWRALPANGQIALFLSAWYSDALRERAAGCEEHWLEPRLERIRRFERMLDADDHCILKFWLHLDKDTQEQRFRAFESDPLQQWRVTESDWVNWARHDRFVEAAEELLEATHTPACPWIVVDSGDARRRDLAVAEALLDAVEGRLIRQAGQSASEPDADRARAAGRASSAKTADAPAVAKLRTLAHQSYQRERDRLQGELNQLHHRARSAGRPLVGVFEGRDAAGKGGAIRRLVPAFDARVLEVVRVGPPSDEELAHHYLWRFWRRLPRAGGVALFDRSWYGRVLVERVEGLIDESAWSRAYQEINDFELQMVEHGTLMLKCWLDVSPEEQARRFGERKRVPYKRWKLTEEDLHNRALWSEYDDAIRDMLERTSTDHAPWVVVPADDKRRARLRVLEAAVQALSDHLDAGSTAEEPLASLPSEAHRNR
ncbi:MAG: polyphosphate:AMP phosphotransferase [Myxococcales bacterium]|nr:polyphosphate:AMP phosphotransferase [Myxococcales bacterium]